MYYLVQSPKFIQLLSQNVNWRLQKNMREGKYHLPTGQMMGYRYDKNGKVVIYEPEARTIQRIYSLYLDGYGCAQIAEFLTSSKAINRLGQIKWERSTIRNILRNEKYVGDFLFQKTFIESPITHREIVNHGIRDQYIVENGHPAIISREDWNKVQEIMDSNAKKFNVPSYKNERYQATRQENPFRGFVICPHCGQNYITKDSRHGDKINRFLMCTTNATSKLCQSDNYPFNDFASITIEMINYLRKNTGILNDYLQKSFKDNSVSTRNEQLSILDNKIEEHRSKLKEIEMYADEFHAGVQKRLIEIISDLTKKKIKLQNESITAENVDSRIRKIIKAFDSLEHDVNSLDNINLTDLFSKAVIVNKGLIYFIIGNPSMKAYPKKPKLLFTKTHKFTVRRTVTTTTFGIVISK